MPNLADIARHLAEKTGADEAALRAELDLVDAAAVGLGIEDHYAASESGAQASRILEVVRAAAGVRPGGSGVSPGFEYAGDAPAAPGVEKGKAEP